MSDLEDKTDIYTVEKLVGFRYRGRVPEWRVRWQGYGPKDDTWETRKNLLMNSSFAFRGRMEELEREYHEKRKQRKGGGARGAGQQKKRLKEASVLVIGDDDTDSVSESSATVTSDSSCEKLDSTSSSNEVESASDPEGPAVSGGRGPSASRNKSGGRAKALRRRRRCIDDLLRRQNARGPSAARDDLGLPASSDSEQGSKSTALQLWAPGDPGGGPPLSTQKGPHAEPKASAAVSPTKRKPALGGAPLRRLRLTGLESPQQQQGVCASEASGAPSSCNSSPEGEAVGAPRAPTGFTVNECSDDEVGPPFLPGPPASGVRGFAASTQHPLQQCSWGPPDAGDNPLSAVSMLQAYSPVGGPAGVGPFVEGPGWPGVSAVTLEGERCWAEGIAAARSLYGLPPEPPFKPCVPTRPNTPCAAPGAPGGLQQGPQQGPQDAAAGAPAAAEVRLALCNKPQGVLCQYGSAASEAPLSAFSPQLALAVPSGPLVRPAANGGGALAAGCLAPPLSAAGALEEAQQQRQQQRHQQLSLSSTGPLGIAKGMLNKYPCESLFPGRVRVVKIVRGEAGAEGGVRGAVVHYVIAACPGAAADPSRNVWGTCSIPDARRFCPGALCDYLLRKALFRNGEKNNHKTNSNSAQGDTHSAAAEPTEPLQPSTQTQDATSGPQGQKGGPQEGSQGEAPAVASLLPVVNDAQAATEKAPVQYPAG